MQASSSANIPKAVDSAITSRSLRNDCWICRRNRGNIVDQEGGADSLKFPLYGRCKRSGVAGAADVQRQAPDALDRLRYRKVDEARRLLA